MSHFSDVDNSGAVQSLTAYLERTDHSMSALKEYLATVFARDAPGGLILDVGCGLGRDLARLTAKGLRPVGLDLSASMLARAAEESPLVLQGDAARLPLRAGSVDGVRIERTLEHVADPGRVLDELARVLRPRGSVAILEPDFSRFFVASDLVPHGTWPAALLTARHPNIGGEIADLLEARGFRLRDDVTERSRSYAFDNLPVDAERVVGRAVADGRCDSWLARAWLEEQRDRTEAGTFRARWDKVLVVASMGQ